VNAILFNNEDNHKNTNPKNTKMSDNKKPFDFKKPLEKTVNPSINQKEHFFQFHVDIAFDSKFIYPPNSFERLLKKKLN
jgi:hypothetical protein